MFSIICGLGKNLRMCTYSLHSLTAGSWEYWVIFNNFYLVKHTFAPMSEEEKRLVLTRGSDKNYYKNIDIIYCVRYLCTNTEILCLVKMNNPQVRLGRIKFV